MKTFHKLRKYFAITIMLSMFFANTLAQTSLQKAQTAAADYKYSKAIELYKDYLTSDSPKSSTIRELVNCYEMIGDTKSAEAWLEKLISSDDYISADIFSYAKILKSNGKYNEAITEFSKYIELTPSEKDNAMKWITSCQKSIERMNGDSIFYEVKNIGSINTTNSEFGLIKIGNEYLFTSDRQNESAEDAKICEWTGNPYFKIYSVKGNIEGTLSSIPALTDSLNSDYHNGQVVYDSINKIIYFTRTKVIKVTPKPINNDPTHWYNDYNLSNYENRLEIYSANYDNGKWGNIKAFEYNNSEYSVGHPALSPNGKILYFASDMPGGYGGTDIYYCEALPNGKWSTPVNTGNAINSEGKEVFPYIDRNGTFYFASDDLKGMGGLDLYSSNGSRNNWSNPVNLGYPVNSPKDDFSIFVTEPGKKGYFSSNRDGGTGKDDIYGFSIIPNKKRVLFGRTFELLSDNSQKELKNTKVNIRCDENNYSNSLISNDKGEFIDVIDLASSYILSMVKNGYVPESKTVKVKRTDGDTIYVDLITRKAKSLVFTGKTKEQNEDKINSISDVKMNIKNINDDYFDSLYTDTNGKFLFNIEMNKPYLLTIAKKDYYTQTRKITAKKDSEKDSLFIETITYTMKDGPSSEDTTIDIIAQKDTFNIDIFLNKLIVNQIFVVKNIYYDYKKWDIKPEAALELDKIIEFLINNPNVSIELSSHTDSRGTTAYNYTLSQKRAESAANYIISKGIKAKRVIAKGYGESQLINKCDKCTEEEHQMNRRTEFKIIKIDKK
jgi:outer membrane protein OmpA-like peptidoglycan-associated protein/tetratricopeptide (TPR) repeat protein